MDDMFVFKMQHNYIRFIMSILAVIENNLPCAVVAQFVEYSSEGMGTEVTDEYVPV